MSKISKLMSNLSRGKENSVFDKTLISKVLQNIKAQNLLDVGCGDGSFTREAADTLRAKEVWGIEIDVKECKKAEKRGVRIICQDLKNFFPFPNDYFDIVLSRQCIEHLYFTDKHLEEVKRVLNPNGVFMLTTTNLAALHYRLMLFFGIQPICLHPSIYKVFPLEGKNPVYGHKSVFTYRALKEVLIKHNFKLLKSGTHSLYPFPRWFSEILCRFFKNIGIYSFFVLKK